MNDQQRAAFDVWASKQGRYGTADCPVDYSRGVTRDAEKVWQAALASPEVQALHKDAERYRKLREMATQQADSLGPIFRIDVRRSAPYLFNFDAAIDHARRVEGRGNE